MTDKQDPGGPGGGSAPQRSRRRHRVMQQARIVIGPEKLLPCVVRDLSPLGAKLLLSRPFSLPDSFDLIIAAHDLRTVSARLRWQRGDVAGVTFADADMPGL